MADYNGSVELISGIKQKNNGTFPLVDATAVRIDDTTRLSDINSPVLYGKSQGLSDAQKAQARSNINAASASSFTSLENAAVFGINKTINTVEQIAENFINSDADNAEINKIYVIGTDAAAEALVNRPANSNAGILYTLSKNYDYTAVCVQYYIDTKTFYQYSRIKNSSGWKAWQRTAVESEISLLTNKTDLLEHSVVSGQNVTINTEEQVAENFTDSSADNAEINKIYVIGNSTAAEKLKELPIQQVGILYTFSKSDSYTTICMQHYVTIYNNKYLRVKGANGWGNWIRMANENDIEQKTEAINLIEEFLSPISITKHFSNIIFYRNKKFANSSNNSLEDLEGNTVKRVPVIEGQRYYIGTLNRGRNYLHLCDENGDFISTYTTANGQYNNLFTIPTGTAYLMYETNDSYAEGDLIIPEELYNIYGAQDICILKSDIDSRIDALQVQINSKTSTNTAVQGQNVTINTAEQVANNFTESNANNALVNRIYVIGTTIAAENLTNLPITNPGVLYTLSKSDTYTTICIQTYVDVVSNTHYLRAKNAGGWSQWRQVATDLNISNINTEFETLNQTILKGENVTLETAEQIANNFTNSNVNNALVNRVYLINTITAAQALTGLPVANTGILYTISKNNSSSIDCVQYYIDNIQFEQYIRVKNSNIWSTWKRIASGEEVTNIDTRLTVLEPTVLRGENVTINSAEQANAIFSDTVGIVSVDNAEINKIYVIGASGAANALTESLPINSTGILFTISKINTYNTICVQYFIDNINYNEYIRVKRSTGWSHWRRTLTDLDLKNNSIDIDNISYYVQPITLSRTVNKVEQYTDRIFLNSSSNTLIESEGTIVKKVSVTAGQQYYIGTLNRGRNYTHLTDINGDFISTYTNANGTYNSIFMIPENVAYLMYETTEDYAATELIIPKDLYDIYGAEDICIIKTQDPIRYNSIGNRKMATSATLNANSTLELSSFPWNLKKGISLSFTGKMSSFTSLYIGKGYNAYRGDWFEIDNTNVIWKHYESSVQTKETKAHGLTISDFINVSLHIDNQSVCHVSITTKTGVVKLDFQWVYEQNNKAFVTVGQNMTNIQFSGVVNDLSSPIWLFGDSYFGVNQSRIIGQLKEYGYADNCLISGLAGNNSSNAVNNNLKKLLEMGGRPEKVVWCLGMNDPSGDVYNQYLTQVINYSIKYKFELILMTIPTIPTRTTMNNAVNTIVRNSGYRYIDTYDAVGTNENGEWYTGYLASDGVHPTVIGAQVIVSRFLTDFPEIMGLGYNSENVDSYDGGDH